jgi:hypothetical protein
MTEFAFERTGESLCSVVDLWKIVSDTLGITTKQAADFVEQKFKAFDLLLFVDDKYTGLWKPCEGNGAIGGRKDLSYLMDAWNSGESGNWSPASFQQWKFLKLTPRGFQAIENAAREIKTPGTVKEDDFSSVQIPEEVEVKKEIDPSDLPEELQAANIAFRAITNGYGDPLKLPRARLEDFLRESYPAFSATTIDRIATVANPDKTTGRKKRAAE